MIDTVAQWTIDEMSPALHVLGELTLSAVDSVPLPLLVVIFLALLASLKPSSPSSSYNTNILPSYSPSLNEKTRLSPLPSSPPQFAYSPPISFRPPMGSYPQYAPLVNPTVAMTAPMDDTRSSCVYVAMADNPSSAVGTTVGHEVPPVFGRRGSKRFGWDGRRRMSAGGIGGLEVLTECVEEKAEV